MPNTNDTEPLSFLSAEGVLILDLPDWACDRETVVALYSAMVRARVFDAKAISLQRTGRLGTFASSLGQEAISVGVASAMRDTDVFLPSFREHGGQLWRGVTLEDLFLYWGGDERGNDFTGAKQDFPVCIPVASQFPIAAGVALSMQQKGEAAVAVAIGGDGATSKGDFYEALNVVGAWDLPAVFVVNNNQWAISVPRSEQTRARKISDKAIAAGLPGEQVDGNDVIAVRQATFRALERARAGKGGTLIECLSYRLGDHTTADDASRYRDASEVSPHWKKEPLARLRTFLVNSHAWGKEEEEGLLRSCSEAIDAAAEVYLATELEPARAMFDHLYATLPDDIAALAGEFGDD